MILTKVIIRKASKYEYNYYRRTGKAVFCFVVVVFLR